MNGIVFFIIKTRLRPPGGASTSLRLMAEARMEPSRMVQRTTTGRLNRWPVLQDAVGRRPDRLSDLLRRQKGIDLWIGEGGAGPKTDPRGRAAIASQDGFPHGLPAVRAVDVVGTCFPFP
jgi:hypothetical protein